MRGYKVFFIFFILLVSSQTQANSFVCTSKENMLEIIISNSTENNEFHQLILSNKSPSATNKIQAVFNDITSVVSKYGANFSLKIDLRFNNKNRANEFIAGTKLVNINHLSLEIDLLNKTTFSNNVTNEYGAILFLLKNNGEEQEVEMSCLNI